MSAYTLLKDAKLLVDDPHGQYMYQIFAQRYRDVTRGGEPHDWDALLAGPEHADYAEAWDFIEQYGEVVLDGKVYRLLTDQGIWAIPEDDL